MTMNELVNQIAEGKAVLLNADDICKRLSVSRSTFDRWVRNSSPKAAMLKEVLENAQACRPQLHSLFSIPTGGDEETQISFPQPDIRIGNSPRWSLDTFKIWLMKNLSQQK
jgi:predicted DNA-binding transcriptional regulator AlpA